MKQLPGFSYDAKRKRVVLDGYVAGSSGKLRRQRTHENVSRDQALVAWRVFREGPRERPTIEGRSHSASSWTATTTSLRRVMRPVRGRHNGSSSKTTSCGTSATPSCRRSLRFGSSTSRRTCVHGPVRPATSTIASVC